LAYWFLFSTNVTNIVVLLASNNQRAHLFL
jgi:hypothetical protein